MTKVSAIILAGGRGSRTDSSTPKQFLELGGKPLLVHSVEIFVRHPRISQVILVASRACELHVDLAPPGPTRQQSVESGFAKVDQAADVVLIHDAARPFVTPDIIDRVIAATIEQGAAVCGVPVADTIKLMRADRMVETTPPRDRLFAVQTPQGIKRDLLERALKYVKAHGLSVTDDVSMVEALGEPVVLVEGAVENRKITYAQDLYNQDLCATPSL